MNDFKNKLKWRIENRPWLRRSQLVALLILSYLDAYGISREELATQLDVDINQINIWVKGQSNFDIDTIEKFGRAFNCDMWKEIVRLQNSDY